VAPDFGKEELSIMRNISFLISFSTSLNSLMNYWISR